MQRREVLRTARDSPVAPRSTPYTALMAKPVDTLRILVVDDAASMGDAVAGFMRSHGAQVAVASSAVEALNILDTLDIDVLVSDIQMPPQDGFWLIHEIRSRPTLRSLPAIAFTGLGRLTENASSMPDLSRTSRKTTRTRCGPRSFTSRAAARRTAGSNRSSGAWRWPSSLFRLGQVCRYCARTEDGKRWGAGCV